MTWIPAAACILAALGLGLGVVQYRKSRPHIPYRGWMRWHNVTGVVFGVLTLTWAFSGLLSMEPWAWSERDEIGPDIQQTFVSRPRDLREFPEFDSAVWASILAGRTVKEIEFVRVLDEPSYIVRTSPGEQPLEGWPDGGHQPYFVSRDPESSRFVVPLKAMAERRGALAMDAVAERVHHANPDVSIVEQVSLFGTETPDKGSSPDHEGHGRGDAAVATIGVGGNVCSMQTLSEPSIRRLDRETSPPSDSDTASTPISTGAPPLPADRIDFGTFTSQ